VATCTDNVDQQELQEAVVRVSACGCACCEAFCDVLKSLLEEQMADSMNDVIAEAKKNKYSLIPTLSENG